MRLADGLVVLPADPTGRLRVDLRVVMRGDCTLPQGASIRVRCQNGRGDLARRTIRVDYDR